MPDPVWYRNTTSGERGSLLERDGKTYMRLNRKDEEILSIYRPSEWIPERENRPMTRFQVAQVTLEADKKLCTFLGKPALAKRSWLNMTDEARIEWADKGPPGEIRGAMWKAMTEALKPWATE
jgi:hypothetical protein